MASATSDRTVVPNQEADESSMVSDPSIQASLQRTSSAVSEDIVSENIAAGDDLSAGMEPSISVASSKTSEITDAAADPSPGMEPSLQTTSSMLDPADDKVNLFIKDLSGAKFDKATLAKHFSGLKQKLKDGLEREAVYAFIEHNNMTEAQKRVQELLDLFEAIEFVIWKWRGLLKTPIPKKDPDQPNFKADYRRIDIYHHLLKHTLNYTIDKTELQENPRGGRTRKDSMLEAYLSNYFGAIDFMVFLINKVQEKEDVMDPSLASLINKVQEEKDIMDPSLALQTAKTSVTKVTKRVNRFEKETIATFICLVVNGEGRVAKILFKRLLKLMKPSDIINRGRVYNYALQKAQELLKVRIFLHSPSLSQRYKVVVQRNGRLDKLAKELYDNQVKVQSFLVNLYLKDGDLKEKIDWEFVKQHDYPHLIQCLWEHHNFRTMPHAVKDYKWTPLQLNYVFTSSAAITGRGQDIMKDLLEAFKAWPALVNVPYKGVTALHVAVFQGNEEAIKCLLEQEQLDINVRTGQLLTTDDVKTYKESGTISTSEVVKRKGVPLPYATVDADREESIKDHLEQVHEELNKDHLEQVQGIYTLNAAKKFIQRIKISRKKWNKNRWNLPTYQTALHIATAQRHANAVQLLCDAPDPHQQRLRCHEEDEEDRTPVDIIYRRLDSFGKDPESAKIEKTLLKKKDVQYGKERLYRNRQILVDAVNTILVVAALIASVTYAGWLQPPLGYAQDYDHALPYPAPPDTYDSYLGVQGNFGVRVFALFNSLSFFFAIATVIVGADAVFPIQRYQYIGHVVQTMQLRLQHAIRFLIISLVCVLGAFGSAAIVVLPPSLFFRKDLVLSIIIGGSVCGYTVWQLLSRHSKTVQRLNAYISDITIRYTNVF